LNINKIIVFHVQVVWRLWVKESVVVKSKPNLVCLQNLPHTVRLHDFLQVISFDDLQTHDIYMLCNIGIREYVNINVCE